MSSTLQKIHISLTQKAKAGLNCLYDRELFLDTLPININNILIYRAYITGRIIKSPEFIAQISDIFSAYKLLTNHLM